MKPASLRAVLTGATGGIGCALVEKLCQEGAHLLVVGRNADALGDLAQRFPDQVVAVQADITVAEGRAAVLAATRHAGGVNALINAAGVNRFLLLGQHTDDDIAQLIGLNVTSAMQLTRLMLPVLHQQQGALVINLGSTFGSIGYPGFTAYCASKFALRGFSEALRREVADTRTKVLYIAPRATRTAMNAANVVALNRALNVTMDNPDDVAGLIVAAIRREREESYFGWPEKLFVRLNGLLPRLVNQALRKQLPLIQQHVQP